MKTALQQLHTFFKFGTPNRIGDEHCQDSNHQYDGYNSMEYQFVQFVLKHCRNPDGIRIVEEHGQDEILRCPLGLSLFLPIDQKKHKMQQYGRQ